MGISSWQAGLHGHGVQVKKMKFIHSITKRIISPASAASRS